MVDRLLVVVAQWRLVTHNWDVTVLTKLGVALISHPVISQLFGEQTNTCYIHRSNH